MLARRAILTSLLALALNSAALAGDFGISFSYRGGGYYDDYVYYDDPPAVFYDDPVVVYRDYPPVVIYDRPRVYRHAYTPVYRSVRHYASYRPVVRTYSRSYYVPRGHGVGASFYYRGHHHHRHH